MKDQHEASLRQQRAHLAKEAQDRAHSELQTFKEDSAKQIERLREEHSAALDAQRRAHEEQMAEARARLEREAEQMRDAELRKMREMQSMTFETQKQQWSQQAESDLATQKAM